MKAGPESKTVLRLTGVVFVVVEGVAGGELVDTLDDLTVHEVTTDVYMTIYKYICSI